MTQGIRYITGQWIDSRTGMRDYYQGLFLETLTMICRHHIAPEKNVLLIWLHHGCASAWIIGKF